MFKDNNLLGSWRKFKAFLKVMDWITFSCQFKVRGQAFRRLNNHSLFQGRGKLLALSFCMVLVLE